MRRALWAALVLALAGLVVFGLGAMRPRHHRAHPVNHSVRRLTDPGTTGPPLFGFNDNSALFGQVSPDVAIARSAHAGANVVRYTVNWDYVEAKKDEWNWHGYDPLYASALKRGMRPILIAAFSPGWARPLDLSCGTAAAHCHNPPDADHDRAWTTFIAELVKRYPKAAAIEVWNEPNLIQFWRGGPDAARYVQLLGSAYRTVKAIRPSMPVLGGALANSQFGGDGSAPYKDYLDAMLALGPVFDGLSIHDYPSAGTAGDWFDQTLNIARDELDSHGRRDTPLWVTEFGISTAGPNPVTAQDQAARLVQMLSELGKRRDVRAGLIHTLIPAPTGPETEEYGYSTLNPDGSVKPAYCALAAARGVRHGRRCPAPPS